MLVTTEPTPANFINYQNAKIVLQNHISQWNVTKYQSANGACFLFVCGLSVAQLHNKLLPLQNNWLQEICPCKHIGSNITIAGYDKLFTISSILCLPKAAIALHKWYHMHPCGWLGSNDYHMTIQSMVILSLVPGSHVPPGEEWSGEQSWISKYCVVVLLQQ